MRSSVVCALGFAALGAAQATTTVRYTITSTVTSTSCVATETVTGAPPNQSAGDASYSVMSVITNPATPLSTSLATSYMAAPSVAAPSVAVPSAPAPSKNATSSQEPVALANAASSSKYSQGAVVASVASMLCMFFAAL